MPILLYVGVVWFFDLYQHGIVYLVNNLFYNENRFVFKCEQNYNVSATKPFTAKDVCAALDASRSRLHQWAQLPPFSKRPTRERSARRYSRADMLTFAVLQTLEDAFGVKSKDLADVSARVFQYLNAPQQIPYEELVFIALKNGDVHSVLEQNIASAGWVIDVARERERIDVYLGVRPAQQEFPLMTDVRSGRQ